ncbi:NEL-type E3 ubiquitin ligase domain-containing protein [Pseudomonas cedrina]|uniref:NEL-type E3 ubiquitin ligase domain-containing protein n=1 Tax=Pseudomonas cedrina TaxID=651740 RepID=UPI00278B43A3|nr:NEL-type E3 ubiquitin ligase domain-containing protein [Pseudomonas cedrina]MDQ0654649.1 Leucine-rich repeat (LRR) protein [Pseudomonas cedrina]
MPVPSFHASFIKANLPGWIKHLAAPDIQALHRARDPVQQLRQAFPEKYAAASPPLRQALIDSGVQRQASTQALATALKDFKGITEFSEPLLLEALRKQFALAPDVNKTLLYHLRAHKRLEQQSLLQAALHNFEADEPFDDVVLQETSGLAPAGSLEQILYDKREKYPFAKVRYHLRDRLAIKPAAFASLCRQLDLGKQYQAHLSAVFETPATAAQVRQQMIQANKDTLRVQTHIARMRDAISETAHTTLLEILDGTPAPSFYGWPVAFSQLNLLGADVNDVVVISTALRRRSVVTDFVPPIVRQYESLLVPSRIIVCMPGDPLAPVKEYRSLEAFLTELAVNLRSSNYQRFFAGLLSQNEAQTFLRRLKSQLKVLRWNPNPVYPGPNYNPAVFMHGIYESVWNDAVKLHAKESFIETNVFGHLYEKHLARIKSSAKLLAVPTEQVDHNAWINRLTHWAEWGLNVINVAAFFVPGLGEVMMAVTAVQLGYEVYQGVEAWSVGDSDEAWAHLTSIMQNVAYMAALGAVAAKAPPILPSTFVNGMARVRSPFGKLRLWHPDLSAYKSGVSLKGLKPDALGQYQVAGKTYITLEGNPYENIFDPAIKQWRIKHPHEIDAYQPILRHNGHGAWRHSLERPLEWQRLALLRRTGPHMERFTDIQVEQIAEVSGVSDEVLRVLHVDNKPAPPEFAQAARLFEVDRQVDEVIGQIREGAGMEEPGQFVVPLAVEMPGWPVEVGIEVLSSPEPWATSKRYGAVSAKQSIKITRSEVAAGKWPEKILAALDEAQTKRVLGDDSVQSDADRLQLLRDRLADHAKGRSKSLFDSLLSGQTEPDADTKLLQRSFRSLSPEAAQHVLGIASADELSQLRSTGRIPLRLAKAVRVQLHQSGLTRALAGLYLENLASTASDRLALHSLEQMPGWSADIRVELRSLGISGPLVDSIGSEQALTRYCLINEGDHFIAMDADGRALNSAARDGRNLFESLLQVVPDTWRRSLGDNPSEALRQQVIDYARSNRDAMSRILRREAPGDGAGRLLRTPGRIGYAASGDVAGFADAPLVARVRDVYPNINDDQALQFIRNRRLAGDSDQQVFHLLESRRREFEGLNTVLDAWVDRTAAQSRGFGTNRREIANRIIACWRAGLYRGQTPTYRLNLLGADELPAWAADFSHVRAVVADSRQVAEGTLVPRFSALTRLEIQGGLEGMADLADQMTALSRITELRLELQQGFTPYSPALTQALQGMTQLQELHLHGSLPVLDYSAYTALRRISLSGNLRDWPTGLLALDRLESVDLSRTRISSLPDALFSGHERLWRGVLLNWKALEPQAFTRAFEYLYQNPSHLVDEAKMLGDYCKGRLESMVPRDEAFVVNAFAALEQEGLSGRALLARVEALHQDYHSVDAALAQWGDVAGPRVAGVQMPGQERGLLADRLRASWRDAQRARYAPREPVAGPSRIRSESVIGETLDLTGYGAPGDLPALNDAVFAHIRHLKLGGVELTLTQLNEFLGRFPQLRELDLSGNHLTELPQALEALSHLTELNLSGNQLTITAPTQARLNRLSALQRLDLSRNRVGSLTVTSLTELISLNLSRTQITAWPEGVLSLPRLRALDLSYSAVSSIPDAAWVGHDVLLAGTGLRGCHLSPQALARAQAFAVSTGPGTPLATMFVNPLGIERGLLAAGRTGGDPEFFPVEVAQQPDLLLPVPGAEPDLPLTSAERLQRLDPQLDTAHAVQRIDTWLAQEVSAMDIEAALSRWQTQHATMIRDFNAWIDRPATRIREGWANATDRRRAADRLLSCWREALRDVSVTGSAPSQGVDLSGLNLGDLPALEVSFSHVDALDLSGTALTSVPDAFVQAFPRLNRLMLNGNPLGELSESVTQLTDLTHLGINNNGLTQSGPLQRVLRALPRLQTLDLGGNRLHEFDVTGLDRLQHLDLNRNRLTDWPAGALEAPALTRLNLRGNEFETIPRTAFEPQYADLMAGTDLFDNPLTVEEFVALREHLRDTGQGLGFTAGQIDRELLENDPGFFEEEGNDVHPELEDQATQKNRWFEGVAADSEKHEMWDTVMAADLTGDFANILAQLRHTHDFIQDRAGLTGRVWDVVEGAYADPALRERLMGIARASRHRETCGDGRMLLFNALEVQVYEANALREIDPTDKGRALLKLSRGLFRLAELEAIASERIRLNPATDPAEIRLAYRVGLAQRLELPSQPRGMIYQTLSRVVQADLDAAYQRIIEQEQTPAFSEQLIARPYWKAYLQEKYADDFARLQQALEREAAALEDQYPEINPEYLQKINTLQKANEDERQALMLQLSAVELAALAS